MTNRAEPSTIVGVVSRLEAILEDALKTGHRIGYFAALYLRVTQSVRRSIIVGDVFQDNARMERLDVIFAGRFLTAWDAWTGGQTPTAPWKLAFEQLDDAGLMAVQQLGVAMNAHINYDLGIAAAQVMRELDQPLDELETDFRTINVILARLTGIVQVQLAELSSTFAKLERPAPVIENHIFGLVLDALRDGAWHLAQRLDGEGSLRRDVIEAERAALTVAAGEVVLHPPGFGDFVASVAGEEAQNGVPMNILILAE